MSSLDGNVRIINTAIIIIIIIKERLWMKYLQHGRLLSTCLLLNPQLGRPEAQAQ